MMVNRMGGLHSLLVMTQIVIALVLFGLMLALFRTRGALDLWRYGLYAGVVALALVIDLLRREQATIRTCVFERSLVHLHPIALRQTFAVLVGLVVFVTLLHDATLSRIFLVSYLSFLYPVLLFSNRLLVEPLSGRFFSGTHEHNILLVGASRKKARLQHWLRHRALLGFRTAGILGESSEAEPMGDLPNLGRPDDLERVIQERKIKSVILLGLPMLPDAYADVSDVCNRNGVRLTILSDLDERLHHPAVHLEDGGLHFITAREEPLENPLNRLCKRTLDLAIALPVIVFILPWICALVWLLQRGRSPGPLFYRQSRAGLHNQEFKIYKFRTMRAEDGDAARQATHGDARLYPGAGWLRRTSLDELPQVINVLWGEMSVVGPRPHLVEHNRLFSEHLTSYHIRSFVRPGMTGLAQVRGFRGEAAPGAIAARLSADLLYLENWSLLLDCGIIARTCWQILFPPRTAY
jgi:putative colanic acid biosynthesis UDP-glucose lipid carrier transferase